MTSNSTDAQSSLPPPRNLKIIKAILIDDSKFKGVLTALNEDGYLMQFDGAGCVKEEKACGSKMAVREERLDAFIVAMRVSGGWPETVGLEALSAADVGRLLTTPKSPSPFAEFEQEMS